MGQEQVPLILPLSPSFLQEFEFASLPTHFSFPSFRPFLQKRKKPNWLCCSLPAFLPYSLQCVTLFQMGPSDLEEGEEILPRFSSLDEHHLEKILGAMAQEDPNIKPSHVATLVHLAKSSPLPSPLPSPHPLEADPVPPSFPNVPFFPPAPFPNKQQPKTATEPTSVWVDCDPSPFGASARDGVSRPVRPCRPLPLPLFPQAVRPARKGRGDHPQPGKSRRAPPVSMGRDAARLSHQPQLRLHPRPCCPFLLLFSLLLSFLLFLWPGLICQGRASLQGEAIVSVQEDQLEPWEF